MKLAVEPCPLMPPTGLTALGEAIYAGGSVAPAINDDSKDEVDAVRACAPQARDLPTSPFGQYALAAPHRTLAPTDRRCLLVQSGRAPLMYACLTGNVEATTELCEAGANVNFVRRFSHFSPDSPPAESTTHVTPPRAVSRFARGTESAWHTRPRVTTARA